MPHHLDELIQCTKDCQVISDENKITDQEKRNLKGIVGIEIYRKLERILKCINGSRK